MEKASQTSGAPIHFAGFRHFRVRPIAETFVVLCISLKGLNHSLRGFNYAERVL
jgi:hypothetical protein